MSDIALVMANGIMNAAVQLEALEAENARLRAELAAANKRAERWERAAEAWKDARDFLWINGPCGMEQTLTDDASLLTAEAEKLGGGA